MQKFVIIGYDMTVIDRNLVPHFYGPHCIIIAIYTACIVTSKLVKKTVICQLVAPYCFV